jgi:phosphatidylglycerophosphate synthase
MRRMSPYLTRLLLPTPLTANGVTWLMLVVGLAAAFMLSLDSVVAAAAAVALIQLQVLLDCSDGELARWRQHFSPAGIYLDRIAHYVTETAFPIALGVRADGGWDSIGGWTTLGLVVAVLALLIRMESALVHVARAQAGKPVLEDKEAVAAPTSGGLRRARRVLGRLPFYRALIAPEATLLAFVAAVVDAAGDDLTGTRVLVAALLPLAAITVVGHLLAILMSSRLR